MEYKKDEEEKQAKKGEDKGDKLSCRFGGGESKELPPAALSCGSASQ